MHATDNIDSTISSVCGALDSGVTVERHALLSPVPLPFVLPTPIYGAMLAIWHLRPMLQRRFPLHLGKRRDYIRFLAWCVADGRSQYAILRALPSWDEELTKPISLPTVDGDRWIGVFSVSMYLYGVARYRYTFGAMLHSATARHRIARAYMRGERDLRRHPDLPMWQKRKLKDNFSDIDGMLDLLRIKLKDAAKSNQQLTEEFGLDGIFQEVEMAKNTPEQSCVLCESDTVSLAIRSRFPFRLPIRLIRGISWSLEQFRKMPNEFEQSSVTNRIRFGGYKEPEVTYPFGVNLFGYAKGELGIGEDVRLMALALKSQGIPFCIINVKPGDNVSQLDSSVDQWIVDRPKYGINIFCTTGIEHVRFACEYGLDTFQERYTIGLWPWELPNWPASCSHAYCTVDEIWGISHYTAAAYRDAPIPVYPMTLPVTIDTIADEGRGHFGLPENDFLFIFSFDFNSTLTRKNPLSVVRAFQQAFPLGGEEQVGLVLKASHVSSTNKHWSSLKKLMKSDPRIYFVGDTLRRPSLLALYKACDCYVSLHRAEGFGRSLAEALLLDMQLITTDYSGNLDFCHADRVALVRHKIRELQAGDYFHADGQYWAEPDVEHAAELMRQVWQEPLESDQSVDFSPEIVGQRYAQRLYQIKQQLEIKDKDK